MSRKDTIIVAVLVNAGLLIVLFATALKSNSSKEEFVANPTPVFREASNFSEKQEVVPVVGDEVDIALKQFAQNSVSPSTPVMQTPSLTPTSDNGMNSSYVNFADDLKAIASPETPTAPSVSNISAQTLVAPIIPQGQSVPAFIDVKVKKGDVLEKIARHHHTTVAEIMKANKLTTTNLRIGQTLKIPNKAIKKAEPSVVVYSPQASSTSNESEAKYYIVKKGDSPWTIAVRNHVKVEDLLKLNSMSEEQARRLKPGDKIRIQ